MMKKYTCSIEVEIYCGAMRLVWDVYSVAISSDGSYVVAGSYDNKVYMFDNYDIIMTLAKQAIDEARQAVNKAKSMGFSPSKAESILYQAKQEFSDGNYERAVELAKQAYQLAIDIDQDGVPNENDFAPEIPNNYIYAGSGIGFVALIAVYSINRIRVKRKLERERYEIEKAEIIREMEELLK